MMFVEVPIRSSHCSGDVGNSFSINEVSGVLITQRELDREAVATYQLVIQARDSGGANSMSSITQVYENSNVHLHICVHNIFM